MSERRRALPTGHTDSFGEEMILVDGDFFGEACCDDCLIALADRGAPAPLDEDGSAEETAGDLLTERRAHGEGSR